MNGWLKLFVIGLLLGLAVLPLGSFAQRPAAELPTAYLPLLKGKRVGLVVNHSARVDTLHLFDFLRGQGVDVRRVFAPEHGFRGNADPGALVADSVDRRTGVPIVSLYGKNKKPSPEQLRGLDVLVFDIQDVGVRFFTYISTMHYAMEAAAEQGLAFVVLDRPNPLGDYVDGPVLRKGFESFVGMHPIPVVHGLTVGELAQMIRGEGWITQARKLNLTVVPCGNYTHSVLYALPRRPSPNLPTMAAVRLYPSLCFFEATDISVGRGTEEAFQQIGYPDKSFGPHSFVPVDRPGMQMNPLHEGKTCYGDDLRRVLPAETRFELRYLIEYRRKWTARTPFISKERWFNLLAGNDLLAKQLAQGLSEEQIRQSWQAELKAYKEMRRKYLLYLDFE